MNDGESAAQRQAYDYIRQMQDEHGPVEGLGYLMLWVRHGVMTPEDAIRQAKRIIEKRDEVLAVKEVTVDDVNVPRLRKQRDLLVTLLQNKDLLDGLVALLDHMLDQAEGEEGV